jgi:hypothetical protein
VTAVAAAGHNGSQIEGVAFNASVLAIKTDTVGSCATTGGCEFNSIDIANAVDYARTNGAKVINISLGGSSTGSTLNAAIGRATAAGIIIVISAGNCGEVSSDCPTAQTQPDPFARVASNSVANGLVVIAGAEGVNNFGTVHPTGNGALASYSNPAGSFGQYYLTALGGTVSIDEKGQLMGFEGTSYAAPAISGAVALIESAFPNLTAAQVVDLLMRSATDAGATGADPVFGRGILNLTAAFAPQGTTSLAGSATPLSLTSNATLGSAMGDSGSVVGPNGSKVAFLDGYGRAYAIDLSSTFGRTGQIRPLMRSIGMSLQNGSLNLGRISLNVSAARNNSSEPWEGMAQHGLTAHPIQSAVPLSGSMRVSLGKSTETLLGFNSGALSPITRNGGSDSMFLIAANPAATPGFDTQDNMMMAVRQRLGRFTLGFDGSSGKLLRNRPEDADSRYSTLRLSGATTFGPLDVGLGLAMMREDGSVLGSRFGPALGGGGATTRLIDIDLGLPLGSGWEAGASMRQGWTRADNGGAVTSGHLSSNAFAFDLAWTGAMDRLGLRIAQPLRVASGGYRLHLPTGYDYGTLSASYTDALLDLAPKGRELDVEGGYGRALAGGWLDTNLYVRRDPGNIASIGADVGAAMRFTLGW